MLSGVKSLGAAATYKLVEAILLAGISRPRHHLRGKHGYVNRPIALCILYVPVMLCAERAKYHRGIFLSKY